jgi:hypothetical protein
MKKIIAFLAIFLLIAGCASNQEVKPGVGNEATVSQNPPAYPSVSRYSMIPANATKMSPASDLYPPILHSDEWSAPIPVGAPIDSAGAEDSPFITPDGNTLYFFFTPDVNVPVEKQILDNVTGIYVSNKKNGQWGEPQRVWLQDPGKLAGDGCEFVQGDTMWFCSVREGYTGVHWFTAEFRGGKWQNWKNADFNPDYQVGELHIPANGSELYFGSSRPGGKGGMDIWMSRNVSGTWGEPENVGAVNTAGDEGWPFLSQDGNELWFLRTYQGSPAIFRSKRINGSWAEPELIISQFAGEPSLDDVGNIYFVHHFYNNSRMIEADIYVAYKKTP